MTTNGKPLPPARTDYAARISTLPRMVGWYWPGGSVELGAEKAADASEELIVNRRSWRELDAKWLAETRNPDGSYFAAPEDPSAPWPVVGLVWPTDELTDVFTDPALLEAVRRHHFASLRYTITVTSEEQRSLANAIAQTRAVLRAGLVPLPTLLWDYWQRERSRAAVEAYAVALVQALYGEGLRWIGLGNEYAIGPGQRPQASGGDFIVTAGPTSQALLQGPFPELRIVLALDLIDHNNGTEREPEWRLVVQHIRTHPWRPGAAGMLADVHNYRNPRPPEFSVFGSREAEHLFLVDQIGAPYIIGETGWKPNEGPEQASGEMHEREIRLAREFGIPMVQVFQVRADPNPSFDFGLFEDTQPRPAATHLQGVLPAPPPPRLPDLSFPSTSDFLEVRTDPAITGHPEERDFSHNLVVAPAEWRRAHYATLKSLNYDTVHLYAANEADLLQRGLRHFDLVYGVLETAQPEFLRAACLDAIEAGLQPVIWWMCDDNPTLRRLTRTEVGDAIARAMPVVDDVCAAHVIGLEMDEYWRSDKQAAIGNRLADLTARPVFAHFRPSATGSDSFWSNVDRRVNLAFQLQNELSDSEFVQRLTDADRQMRGRGRRLLMAEYTQGQRNMAFAQRRGRLALGVSGVLGAWNGA